MAESIESRPVGASDPIRRQPRPRPTDYSIRVVSVGDKSLADVIAGSAVLRGLMFLAMERAGLTLPDGLVDEDSIAAVPALRADRQNASHSLPGSPLATD